MRDVVIKLKIALRNRIACYLTTELYFQDIRLRSIFNLHFLLT